MKHIYNVVGPQLTALIVEVSLFQSVHNSRFDCMLHECMCGRYMYVSVSAVSPMFHKVAGISGHKTWALHENG